MARKSSRGKLSHNVSGPSTYVELDLTHEQIEILKGKKINNKVNVVIVSYRHERADADGPCAKALLDSLVRLGVLPDDSQDWIEEIIHVSKEVEKKKPEKTILVFLPADSFSVKRQLGISPSEENEPLD
jgi:Holliday junction resolvase RusA-like endonuclease